ncbi:oligopeptide/dipeptide ABC transporter ATP-binding protein [Microbacterium sp. NPDC055599]
MTAPLLAVEQLRVHFRAGGRRGGVVHAVDGLDLVVRDAEFVGVIGESGCGKSSMGRALVHLNPVTSGRIVYRGDDITAADRADRRRLRREIQFMFQDPHSSLNPRFTAREILREPLRAHGIPASEQDLVRMLDRVALPADALDRYPHEFSGGQRQRIGLARAMALSPRLLVLDEPVSGLDVSVQAQVLNLLADIRRDSDTAFLMITHDLEVVRHSADRVVVMYLGVIVEEGPAAAVLDAPAHPYTRALVSAMPNGAGRERIVLGGELPSPLRPPSGCRFRTRCWKAVERCAQETPPLAPIGGGRAVACHFPEDVTAAVDHRGAST